MRYITGLICWALVSISLFGLIGLLVAQTHKLWLVCFIVLPFFLSVKSTEEVRETE